MKQHYCFSKYHGLGNDFILLDGIAQRIDQSRLLKDIPRLCDRHFGIGADGVVLVLESESCDLSMKIYNADGSSPEMCGNGLRCFARFVYEKKIIEKDLFSVETLAGKMLPAILTQDSCIQAIEVDMGVPQEQAACHSVEIHGQMYDVYTVSMGNPHAVIFVDDLEQMDLEAIGQFLQTHSLFPEGVNVELVQCDEPTAIRVVVWERGVGPTLACGTGACAAVVAGVHAGKVDRKVQVQLPGGSLLIHYQDSDDHVIKTGPATHVYDGEFWL